MRGVFNPRLVISEQGTRSVPEYRRRVRRLAIFYAGIVVFATSSIVMLVVRGRLFVTLAQRSNVETATIAVVILLFAYLDAVSLRGAIGAVRIAALSVPAAFGADRASVESRKQQHLSWSEDKRGTVYLNVMVRRAGGSDEPIRIDLADDHGSLGTLCVDGAEMAHEHAPAHSSNSIFAYFEQRIEKLAEARDPNVRVSIVEWTSIDDDSALRYGSMVTFSRRLEEHLGCGALWPSVELTDDDLATLQREARELCPILRNEAFLPDLEYEAEHRLPIIPEPLAFVTLSRSERRADPHASMGCAFLVTLLITIIVAVTLWLPPWVPGK
jgi:hypothetical protein